MLSLFQNLSQQSDVADLLGGFKPLDAGFAFTRLYIEFIDLFNRTFSEKVSFHSPQSTVLLVFVSFHMSLICTFSF